MNEIQKGYIGWFLIILLMIAHLTINSIIFMRTDRQESDSIKMLSENIDELKISLESNQARLEKKIFNYKKSLYTQSDQADVKYKNAAKSLLLIDRVKYALLHNMKFDGNINELRFFVLKLDDQDIDHVMHELENIREIQTLHELRASFAEVIDIINYSQSSSLKKMISHWVKVKNSNDPLRVKWVEIESLINENDWRSIDLIVSNLTHPEFKSWINRLHNFITTFRNIDLIYQLLLQYIQ